MYLKEEKKLGRTGCNSIIFRYFKIFVWASAVFKFHVNEELDTEHKLVYSLKPFEAFFDGNEINFDSVVIF